MFAQGITCSTFPAFTPAATCTVSGPDRLQVTLPPSAFARAGLISLSLKNPGQQKAAVMPVTVESPAPVILEVTDAASYRLPTAGEDPRLASGAIIAIFGTDLGPARGIAPKADSARNLPLKAGEVEVEIDGVKIPILYADQNQITAMLPYSTPLGPHAVRVLNWGKRSDPMNIEVVETYPALFTRDSSGSGLVAASNYLDSNKSEIHSTAKPAKPGSHMSLYGTGFGPIQVLDDSRLVPRQTLPTVHTVEACVGTGPCEPAKAAVAAPDSCGGLVQINIQVPTGLEPGWHAVVLKINGTESQSNAMIAVAP